MTTVAMRQCPALSVATNPYIRIIKMDDMEAKWKADLGAERDQRDLDNERKWSLRKKEQKELLAKLMTKVQT
jgi:hypothetical protein